MQYTDKVKTTMASGDNACELPNLKIEIDNYLGEPMETDDGDGISEGKHSGDDAEEGEISDSKELVDGISTNLGTTVSALESAWEKRYENKGGGFLTGVDIFGEQEQSKLGERAIRFGLNPSEIKNVSEEQLKALYKSLGVKNEEEKHLRLNALHMRGTENMSTQDIFNYFKDYGPASIEWINDYTCNVVWLDEISAARALLGLSTEIKGLKPLVPRNKVSTKEKKSDEEEEEEEDVDLVVVEQICSKEGEIIMVVDEIHDKESKEIKASDITIPIPPGLWRKGVDSPKAKCILLRFTTHSDKKLPRAERMSDYYKKHGNPNYGGIRGLLTPSRKRRYKRNEQSQIFDDDLGDGREFRNAGQGEEDSKNPWGNLARSWSNIDKNRGKKQTDRYYGDSPPRKMTPPPSPLQDGTHHSSVLKRLGTSSNPQPDDNSLDWRDDDREWTRRSKVPRMRMYADEEQVRVQRRASEVPSDLRNRLGKDSKRKKAKNPRATSSWSPSDRDSQEERIGNKQKVEFDGGDLRSKLNFKKNLKGTSSRQKSPLRIEIDNDEYYRLIGSDQE